MLDSTNQEKLEALLATLDEEKADDSEVAPVEEVTEEKDDNLTLDGEELTANASETVSTEEEEKSEDEESEEKAEDLEESEGEVEEEEEKTEDEESEEKADPAVDIEMEEDEESEEDAEDVSEEATEDDEEDEEEESDEKSARRVVLVDSAEESTEEKEDNTELLSRRQELIAELAQIEKSLTSDEPAEKSEELQALRSKRLIAMGYQEEDVDSIKEDAILCAIERKMLPNSEPCAFCRGGCAAEKGLPGLLDIEAMAMDSFKGDILDSGYAPNDDLFVVDIKGADGRTIEAFYDGEGNAAGWVLLAQDSDSEEKSEIADRKIISMQEAEEIALKSVEGVVLGVDASVFEGYDAWAVQVEGADGKSYDHYVGLDGTVLGFDEYDPSGLSPDLTDEEKAEIKSIEAELHFKREFSKEQREELAEEGKALPDGSFPIVNVKDLRNAIQAIGRARNPEVAKAHIMKRAAELTREDMIPEEWMNDGKSEDAVAFLKQVLDFQNLVDGLENE